jgi:hypothetical protein
MGSGSNTSKNMSKDKTRNGSNLGYYCGAKFDTIPTIGILPQLPNHWRVSESKSTPSSPVPTSGFETIHVAPRPPGSNVPNTSGRNTAPVFKAASLPSPTDYDINASFKKMVHTREEKTGFGFDKEHEKAKSDSESTYKGKRKGKGQNRQKFQKKDKEFAVSAPAKSVPVPARHENGAPKKASIVAEASSKEGHILMAMLQSGLVKTETYAPKVSPPPPQLAPTPRLNKNNAQSSSPVKTVDLEPPTKLTSELRTPTQITYYGASCQPTGRDSSEHLKALLKVCT